MGLKFSGGLNPLFNSSLPEGPTNQKFLPAGQLNITPRAGTSGSIDDLYDVVITNPVLNDILTYDAAVPAWKNVSLIAGNGLTQTFFQLDKTLTVVAAANGGITVNANGVSVNNTVVRTTGDYTLTGNITINGILTTNNSSNVIDATTLDSQDSTYYRNATNINAGTLAAARLATSGVTANTYGSSTAIPVLTVDDKGRVTVASTVAHAASSETAAGIVRFATAQETNTATSAALAVSPINLAAYYAKRTSPTLMGTPLAPTPSVGNTSTQIATAEFVSRDAVMKAGSTMTGTLTGITSGATTAGAFSANTTGGSYASMWSRYAPYRTWVQHSGSSYAPGYDINYEYTGQFAGKYSIGHLAQNAANPGSMSIMHIDAAGNNVRTWLFAGETGNFTSSGNVIAYSDIRLKTNIETIPNALDKVSQLTGVVYDRIDTGARQTGLIAQEVQKVLPEAVQIGADEEQTLSVAYGNLAGLLVEAIKELKEESKRQANVIAEQAMIIAELTKRIK